MFKILATTVALSLAALGAHAATVTINATSTQGSGNTAHIYGAGYGANTPVGGTFSADATVTPPPGNISGVAQSPFNNTPIVNTQSYFSVGAESGLNGALSPVTLDFGSVAQDAFKILWGSIDSYNTIEFALVGGGVFSYTGTQLGTALGFGPTTNYERVALLTFDNFGAGFTAVTFKSTSAAFEFALAPVPLPAGGLLLIGAIGGLAALRRRKA